MHEVSGIELEVLTFTLPGSERKNYLHYSYRDQSVLSVYVHYTIEEKYL